MIDRADFHFLQFNVDSADKAKKFLELAKSDILEEALKVLLRSRNEDVREYALQYVRENNLYRMIPFLMSYEIKGYFRYSVLMETVHLLTVALIEENNSSNRSKVLALIEAVYCQVDVGRFAPATLQVIADCNNIVSTMTDAEYEQMVLATIRKKKELGLGDD